MKVSRYDRFDVSVQVDRISGLTQSFGCAGASAGTHGAPCGRQAPEVRAAGGFPEA